MLSSLDYGQRPVTPASREYDPIPVAYPGILFGGGGSTNSVEDGENGDLLAVAH